MLCSKNKQDLKDQFYKVNMDFWRSSVNQRDLLNHFSKFGKILKIYISPKNEKDDPYFVCADKITFARILKKPEHIINGVSVLCSPRDSVEEYDRLKQELEDKYRILNQDKIHIRGIHRRTNDGNHILMKTHFEHILKNLVRYHISKYYTSMTSRTAEVMGFFSCTVKKGLRRSSIKGSTRLMEQSTFAHLTLSLKPIV